MSSIVEYKEKAVRVNRQEQEMITRRVALTSGAAMIFGSKMASGQAVQLELRVELSSDRDQMGTLRLYKQGVSIAGPFRAFGRSDTQKATTHQNPTRDPTRPYGDTPTGTYDVPRAVTTGEGTSYSNHSYGPNGALVLKPTSGQAATAAANGRIGLFVHGGDPGQGGKLRATHGCIRLSNADMAALMAAISMAGENPRFNRCELTRINATVGEPGDFVSGEDTGDPPPGIQDLLGMAPIILPPRR
jgi:hypothetical protein